MTPVLLAWAWRVCGPSSKSGLLLVDIAAVLHFLSQRVALRSP